MKSDVIETGVEGIATEFPLLSPIKYKKDNLNSIKLEPCAGVDNSNGTLSASLNLSDF